VRQTPARSGDLPKKPITRDKIKPPSPQRVGPKNKQPRVACHV
jgi:hypothetical protein